MDWKKGCISVINYAEMNLHLAKKDALQPLRKNARRTSLTRAKCAFSITRFVLCKQTIQSPSFFEELTCQKQIRGFR
jgi:hypothetical protein